jgi:hypothetical protein
MTLTIPEMTRLYNIIANKELPDDQLDLRAGIVYQLSQETRQSFLNTKDFHAKMSKFLDKKETINDKI